MKDKKIKILCVVTAVLLLVFGAVALVKTQKSDNDAENKPAYTRADCKKAMTELLFENLDKIIEDPEFQADKPKECVSLSKADGEALANEIIVENMDKLVEKGFDVALEEELSR